MKKNLLKKLFTEKRPALGIIMTMYDPGIALLAAQCGYDWVFMDGEHNPFTSKDVWATVNILRDRDTTLAVRIGSNNKADVKIMLDIGAQGVIVPQLDTENDFMRLVEYGKYPPLGKRGYSPQRASDFWEDIKATAELQANQCATYLLL